MLGCDYGHAATKKLKGTHTIFILFKLHFQIGDQLLVL
jgi:hypothetical protein